MASWQASVVCSSISGDHKGRLSRSDAWSQSWVSMRDVATDMAEFRMNQQLSLRDTIIREGSICVMIEALMKVNYWRRRCGAGVLFSNALAGHGQLTSTNQEPRIGPRLMGCAMPGQPAAQFSRPNGNHKKSMIWTTVSTDSQRFYVRACVAAFAAQWSERMKTIRTINSALRAIMIAVDRCADCSEDYHEAIVQNTGLIQCCFRIIQVKNPIKNPA